MFICIHNSGRSQMGEAFLRQLAGERFEVHSAGLEAGRLNPLVVRAMAEIGIDMAGHHAKTAREYLDRGERFDYVITVCDETNAERCPVFPGKAVRLHWGFPDPSALGGSDEEKLAGIRPIRDAIQARIKAWIAEA
jgi:arsenate reductase